MVTTKHALESFTGITKEVLLKRIERLTKKELRYFKIMLAKSGVLYITSKPGIAKSAIIKSIANKLGFQFFDIRLSMIDETDVGLFPKIGKISIDVEITDENGKLITKKEEYDVLQHVVPEWAFLANQKPTIIFFEELNRAQLAVRNAALQILLERSIGFKFNFTDNVLMVASGNLGEEDGTEVEEFDSALNNRLIHVKHDLNIDDWTDGYAKFEVHPTIVAFLNHNAEHFYKKAEKEAEKAYATPRSWTFLSDYINTNYPPIHDTTKDGGLIYVNENGKVVNKDEYIYARPKLSFAPIKQWLGDIKENGVCYVGASVSRFLRYCEESLRISIKDVIDRFPEIKNDLKVFNRDKHSELLNSLKEYHVFELTDNQCENIKQFLTTMSDDEVVGYLLHVLDDEYHLNDSTTDKKNEKVKNFIKDKRFKQFFNVIYQHCSEEKKDK